MVDGSWTLGAGFEGVAVEVVGFGAPAVGVVVAAGRTPWGVGVAGRAVGTSRTVGAGGGICGVATLGVGVTATGGAVTVGAGRGVACGAVVAGTCPPAVADGRPASVRHCTTYAKQRSAIATNAAEISRFRNRRTPTSGIGNVRFSNAFRSGLSVAGRSPSVMRGTTVSGC